MGGASQHTDDESDDQLAASEDDGGNAGVTDDDREFLAAYNRFVSESVRILSFCICKSHLVLLILISSSA